MRGFNPRDILIDCLKQLQINAGKKIWESLRLNYKSFNKCGSKLLCIIMETVCQYTHFNSIWDEFHYIY